MINDLKINSIVPNDVAFFILRINIKNIIIVRASNFILYNNQFIQLFAYNFLCNYDNNDDYND